MSKGMNLSVVRLCFQAYLPDEKGFFRHALEPVFGQKVYDSSEFMCTHAHTCTPAHVSVQQRCICLSLVRCEWCARRTYVCRMCILVCLTCSVTNSSQHICMRPHTIATEDSVCNTLPFQSLRPLYEIMSVSALLTSHP